MDASGQLEIDIPPIRTPADWMVTARSYLVDRFAPDCEVILLPERETGGGTLSIRSGVIRAEAKVATGRIAGRLRRRTAGAVPVPPGRRIINLRSHTPSNWAHFLNNHLPLVFRITEEAGLDWSEVLLLVPEKTPAFLFDAAQLFGLELWATDAAVEGAGIEFAMNPWVGVRAARADWVRSPRPRAALTAALAAAPDPASPLPRRVFLSRRDTRVPLNAAEVEAWLADRGFDTVYPETLPAADQIRLFRGAETIVAVHGAGLAPLLYCGPDGGPSRLIEILPCGHVTDVFRVIAHRTGCAWIGVRGRLKPAYVRPAYDLGKPFRAYSLDNFEIDVAALERAFELIDSPAPG